MTKAAVNDVENVIIRHSDSNSDESDAESENDDRLSSESDKESEVEKMEQKSGGKSGMAGVIARILSKDISKSNRVLLAKGKTNKEILKDISERKRLKEEQLDAKSVLKNKILKDSKESDYFKDEKKKIWESMGRKIPSVLDNPKEIKLRKIATQGMVQLFSSVNEHQKVMNDRLSSVGSSERKKDSVMSEFTTGKFLDLLKGKKEQEKPKNAEGGAKWDVLKDDYMMGANLKDWDKDDDSEGEDFQDEESMEADDVLSDND
ncbi:pre-60S ribosomal particles component [Bulinus truncatus]|nr:pre-60S ribosomal particles component [Bulinus truncatus]